MRRKIFNIIVGFIPLLIFLILWEFVFSSTEKSRFLFAAPSLIYEAFVVNVSNGVLVKDFIITGYETLIGLLIGNTAGIIIGLSLWYSKRIAQLSRPYIIAIGSIPIFALAPMMIIWFGTGLFAKIMMAAISTFIIAVTQSYEGAKNVDPSQIMLLKSFGANNNQVFKKLVIPSSLIWLFNSLKLNVSFAILGAFIGEFISADVGLGYRALKASGLYDVPLLISAVLGIVLLALFFSLLINLTERYIVKWK